MTEPETHSHCPMKRAEQLRLGFMASKAVVLKFCSFAISKQVSPLTTPTTLSQLNVGLPLVTALIQNKLNNHIGDVRFIRQDNTGISHNRVGLVI